MQYGANRTDPTAISVSIDEFIHDFNWRSISTLAKKALANFSISFARRFVLALEGFDALWLCAARAVSLSRIPLLLSHPVR